MTTLVVLQPSYLPWLGYFDQIHRSDIFVFYDDVQYDKHGWRNRNRVKTAKGPCWLTVPVLNGGRMGQAIRDVEIADHVPWVRKHLNTIEQAYAHAPFAGRYLPALKDVLEKPWRRLVDLDMAVIALMCNWLGIQRPMYRASDLAVKGDRNGRLLALCKYFCADRYLSGNAAMSYLDTSLFSSEGISVEWQNFDHPSYAQLHGEFIPYLSAIDLILNVGPESALLLKSGRQVS
ncbi:WbqC family protein [Azospirillum endophyticum]